MTRATPRSRVMRVCRARSVRLEEQCLQDFLLVGNRLFPTPWGVRSGFGVRILKSFDE